MIHSSELDFPRKGGLLSATIFLFLIGRVLWENLKNLFAKCNNHLDLFQARPLVCYFAEGNMSFVD